MISNKINNQLIEIKGFYFGLIREIKSANISKTPGHNLKVDLLNSFSF